MDLRAPAALVRAHALGSWNQIVRSAGLGGKVATSLSVAAIGIALAFPAALAFRGGWLLGVDFDDPQTLAIWNAAVATFSLLFGLLGSFRLTPAFAQARYRRYPLTSLQFLLAEVPASLFEVFPLLGGSALVLLNLGLAARRPVLALPVAVLTLDTLIAMIATIFLGGALLFAVVRHKVISGTVALVTLIALVSMPHPSLRPVLRAVADHNPLAYGYRGVARGLRGEWGSALVGVIVATAASAALFVIAAAAHRARLVRTGERRSVGSAKSLEPASTAGALGRFFLRQLLQNRGVRAHLFLPLFFAAPVAGFVWLQRVAAAQGKALPDDLAPLVGRADHVPWLVVLPFIAVGMNPPIWMNQFGFDRRGMRTLLSLPLTARDHLTGKLRGLAGFTAIQCAIALPVLLLVRVPDIREVLLALAGACVALAVTTAAGHGVSLRFPRAIDGTAGLQVPLYLSWVGPATLLATAGMTAGVHAIAELIAEGAGVVAALLLAVAAAAAYRAMLPRLENVFRDSRERLLSM